MTIGEAIAAEAAGWLGTPFVWEAGVRGQGVDCAWFLIRVCEAVGVVPVGAVDPRPYPRDWHLHRNDHRYEQWLGQYLQAQPPGTAPVAGDVVLFRFGRAASHAAIVVEWPRRLLHAHPAAGVEWLDVRVDGFQRRVAGVWRAVPRGV